MLVEYLTSNFVEVLFEGSTFYVMLALIVLSSFFSLSETVFSSVKLIRLETLVREETRGSATAYKVSQDYDKTLTTILVGNNIVNIGLATLSVALFRDLLVGSSETLMDLTSTFVMTVIILIFGEILPKTYGKRNADKLVIIISPIFNILNRVMFPITVIFLKLQKSIIKEKNKEVSVTESELDTIIGTMTEEGIIEDDEMEMLQSVLNLNDINVGDIMTPRVDMQCIDVEQDIEEIKEKFFELQFSRVPVFEETKDNIIGVLYERDFFTAIIKGDKVDIKRLLKKAIFVPTTMKVDTLIEKIQIEKQHMAIVVGEYGGTDGLVTMEDALEELVGEIYDEHDNNESKLITKSKENQYYINSSITIDDFFEELELGEAPEFENTSLGGLLIELNDNLPEEGDYIKYNIEEKNLTLNFKVIKIKDRRIISTQLNIEEMKKDAE